MIECIYVGLGGFIGSVFRYLFSLIPVETDSGFPYKTLGINVIGAFVLGAISAWAAKRPEVSPHIILMLKVGVCGGFTTFSTFAFESSTLLSNGKSLVAVIYVVMSLVSGILAVIAGQYLLR